MSHLFLALSLISSLMIAISLRIFENKGRDRSVVIASNYIVAGTLGLFLTTKSTLTPAILIFGTVVGLFFFVAFLVFSRAIKSKGITSAVTIGRLSLAIPVALSILLWGEKPLTMDIASLIIIFCIIISWDGKIGKISGILVTLFLLFGGLDSAMKFFKLQFPSLDDGFFLIIVFYSAMVWSWGFIYFKGKPVKGTDMAAGLLIGVPNFFSSYFLLKALALIPAYIVFPFLNVGMIVLSALSGYLIFKEKLELKKVVLLILGIISVFILTSK